jgi:putative PEP-CTERM system TPR-repeat lipoprotein
MKHSSVTFPGKRLALITLLALSLAACSGEKPEAMIASARDYMAKNDLKAAVIQAKNALQENPELPEARYILGLALLQGGDPVGAETELRKARALNYSDDKVVPSLARAMLLQGQFKKVTEDFSGIQLTVSAAKAEYLTTLASAHLALNEKNPAQQALAAALEADPAYAPALLLKARALGVERKYDEALALADSILDKDAKNYEGWKLKGDLLQFGKDQTTEAQAAYGKSVAISPGYVFGHSALLTLLFKQGDIENAGKQLEELKKVAPNLPQTRYFETLLAFQKKDLKLARELSQQLLKVVPNDVQSLVLAGAIELQSNSLAQAEAYLAKAAQAAPDFLLVRQLLTTTYLRRGQPEKALATLQPALKGDDPGARVNALAGEVYLQNGDINKAEEYFSKAAKQEPKNTRSSIALALTHLASGKDSGFGELQSVAAADSGITADLALISVQLRRGEFDKALAAIAALEKKEPDRPLASSLRGRTLLAKKDVAGARKAFESSIAIDPAFFPSVVSLAAMDIAEKKIDSARKRFDTVLAKNSQHPQALLALAELRSREGGPKAEVADLINKAVEANPTQMVPRRLLIDFHLRNKDTKLALSAAQNAVAAIPDNADLIDALGRAQQASGDVNQALITFNGLTTLQPNSPLPHMRIAEAQLMAKNKSAAAQSLRKALDVKADHLDAQRGLYLLAIEAKNYEEAMAIARTIQKQRPSSAVGFQFEGDAAAVQKKWDAAADAYRKGLKLGAFPELASKLHSTLNANGQTAEADKVTANWLKEHPKDTVYPLYLANIALVRDDLPAAEKLYRGVIQDDANNAIAYNNLAWVTGKLKKDGAVALAEKAIALVPTQPAYMDTLAMLLSDKDDYAKALEWQNKALAIDPQNAVYKLNLAKIYIKGGKKDLARKELDELAKLGDKFRGQAEVAQLIKSL